MDPDVSWRNGRGYPLAVHYLAELQSVHGIRCYYNIQVYMLIALYTANVYRAEHEMSASAVLVLALCLVVSFVLLCF